MSRSFIDRILAGEDAYSSSLPEPDQYTIGSRVINAKTGISGSVLTYVGINAKIPGFGRPNTKLRVEWDDGTVGWVSSSDVELLS